MIKINKQLNNNKLEVAPVTNIGHKKMKKIMAVLTVLMCFISTNAFAQEVRGVETRKVKYDRYYNGRQETWWGFEFHNANSISVSVDIELYSNFNGQEKLEDTKTVILDSDETYVFKQENNYRFSCNGHYIEYYYVRYKAFKLQ